MNEPYTQQGTMSNTNNQNGKQQSIRVNWLIKAADVRVIDEDGKNLGVMKTSEAIALAREQAADLIEINGKSNPPVAKIMELGKFKFDEKKKANIAKKAQFVCETKEVQIRPTTAENDLLVKAKGAKEFLEEGHRVRIVCKFRGREMSHQSIGYDQLNTIIGMLGEKIVVVSEAKAEAKTVSVIVGKEK